MGLTRAELWGLLDGITPVQSVLLNAYENEEAEIWRKGLGDSPHGNPWYTSFHASSFPGEDDSVCGREQVYALMNPAPEAPIEPWLRGWFDLGSNLEHDWVRRLSRYGVLLSADVTGEDEYQTGLSDPSVWLTGSPDAIILPPFWNKGHITEIKTTEHEKVLKMLADPDDTPYSHKKYLRQLKTYIGEAHEQPFTPTVVVCEQSGLMIKNGNENCIANHRGKCQPKVLRLLPPDDGTLIYSSREEPLKVVTYYASYDPEFMKAGKEKLEKWKQYFLNDEIPPHVREGESAKWSEGQCKYCKFKKPFCKTDYKEKTKKLSESALIEFSQKIRPDYDPVKTMENVVRRWA